MTLCKNTSQAIATANALCRCAVNAQEHIDIVSSYIMRSVFYDHVLAFFIRGKRVTSHTTDLAKVMKNKRGICSDYAWMMKVMLNSQGVCCRVIYGMADGICHAWNEVLVKNKWVTRDLTYEQSGVIVNEYKRRNVWG